ncbi:FkbM family methyltransferase [Ruegeria sp. 6PALISEP08]|uniref:FkbM family methyltransferase n=1 Tax=Ruegeria sp. 6PALISEP08 TaxID=1225660 RepID=UPI00067F6334|nr:FkbM family methyltransferase [Ruegeria sp. 6PALISEP08]
MELIRDFAEPDPEARDGLITNFRGVRIEPRVMPSILEPLAGSVEAIPDPGNWHADIAEWAAALLSVKEASGTYRIIELGCGWACWLNNMGFVAKKRGLNVDLIGIEGDGSHLANAERTFQLNGFNPDEFRLVNGVAASKEGIALFPKFEKAHENWGAEPIFYPNEEILAKARAKGNYTELDCYTLENLSNGEAVDLLHIDIQGSELDFVRNNFDSIEKLVKRVFIGTHSRYLEGALQEFFLSKGWKIEMDRPVIHTLIQGRPQIETDGVLLFKNPNHNKLLLR